MFEVLQEGLKLFYPEGERDEQMFSHGSTIDHVMDAVELSQ